MKFEERIKGILNYLGISPSAAVPLTGDASARRFFRLVLPGNEGAPTAILIIFPEGSEPAEVERYTRMAEGLKRCGLPVPKIYRSGPRKGYIVVEDCGDELLQDVITRRDPLPLYRQAIDLIVETQERISPDTAGLNPPFDQEKFLWELNFFLTHTLEGFYRAKLDIDDRIGFQNIFLRIGRAVRNQPRVFCHRDYHSRNILVRGARLRIVDFQDGRVGPYTYDLVSLLEDPYIELDTGFRQKMKEYYLSLKAPQREKNFFSDFHRDYDMMLIQRLLKAAGTYGYMFLVKGRPDYLKYLPTVFRRVDGVLDNYQEFRGLRTLITKYSKY